MSVEHHDIDVGDDLRLHVATSGSGPAVLLLHGFTGSIRTWESLRPQLELSRSVVALDLPGHGRSSSPGDVGRYRLGRLADDIVRILDHLAIDSADVLGYSMGGRAALHFAAAHCTRTRRLVLESVSPGVSAPEPRAERLRADIELAEFLGREGVSAFVDRWEALPLWQSQQKLDPAALTELRAQRLANDARGLAMSLRGAGAAVDPITDDALARLDTPTLVVAGELDAKYVQIARTLEQTLPHARAAIIPDAGHAIHLERPHALIAETLDFLNGPSIVRHDTSSV